MHSVRCFCSFFGEQYLLLRYYSVPPLFRKRREPSTHTHLISFLHAILMRVARGVQGTQEEGEEQEKRTKFDTILILRGENLHRQPFFNVNPDFLLQHWKQTETNQ